MKKQKNYPIPITIDHISFLSRIRVDNSGCWIWISGKRKSGYGYFYHNSKQLCSHRVSFSIFVRSPSEHLVIDHICRNRLCVNPDHLREVTVEENSTENSICPIAINKQKEICKHGHGLSDAYIGSRKRKNGTFGVRRTCRICTINNQRKIRNMKYGTLAESKKR